MVERSLSMREVPGSIPGFSTFVFFGDFFFAGGKCSSLLLSLYRFFFRTLSLLYIYIKTKSDAFFLL